MMLNDLDFKDLEDIMKEPPSKQVKNLELLESVLKSKKIKTDKLG